MQISALADIVEGELLNDPSISFITQTHTTPTKINDGDAFFATSRCEEDIKVAISKGAFAIICDFEPNIIDNEIAWIEVDNIKKAITNMLRYQLLKHRISFIQVDKIFYHLLQILRAKEMQGIIVLGDNIIDDFEVLNQVNEDKVIFGTDAGILNSISPNIAAMDVKPYDVKNLTSNSLFETTFSYKDKYFDKIKIPLIYVNHLLKLLEVFEYKLDPKRLSHFDLFEPIFVNKSNQVVPFGQTNRFIIANKDSDIYTTEIEYLKEHYCYASLKIVNCDFLSDEELFEEIRYDNYNALYCIGKNTQDIKQILEANDNTDVLF